MRTEKSCGPDTPTLVSSSWDNNSTDNGGKRARSPGRARRKPLKPLCAGMPGCSGGPVVTNARVYYTTRAAAGASAPGIPHALLGAEDFVKARTLRVARSRALILPSLRGALATKQSIFLLLGAKAGLLRGACHRARVRATRWLAMTEKLESVPLPRRLGERSQNSRPRTDALVKALQVVFFVRRVDVVVVQSKTHQHGIEPKRALEIRNDRDRCAGAHQHGFLAPLLGQRALGGDQRLHVPVERDRGRAGMVAEFGPAIARQPRADVIAKGLSNLEGVLPFHQAERDLCGSFRRDHRLRTLSGVAADDAIDVAGRARRCLFNQQAAFFAGGNRKPHRLEKGPPRHCGVSPMGPEFGREIPHSPP